MLAPLSVARSRRLWHALPLLVLLALPGCGAILRLEAPPVEATVDLPVLGIQNARFWPDGPPDGLMREAEQMIQRAALARSASVAPRTLPPAHFLALSGGGDNGAYGAGVMAGWTASGIRPQFDIVTGISAGALIAPFAFLGPAYDQQLREVFTSLAPTDLLRLPRILMSALLGEAVADTSPLFRVIQRYANEDMLAAIAQEYARGRLLLIGTTSLDLQRPVIWNIGAIAASGHPDALELFQRVLLASASIPGAFPPVMINVEHEGRRHQEMHVDGGASTQVFFYPPSLNLRELVGGPRQRTIWVIRNGRVDVEGASTNRSIFAITRRSAATLLHFSGLGDISRIYLAAERDGLNFRLTYIGSNFVAARSEPFDPGFMNALFDYGFAKGRTPEAWVSVPPAVGSVAEAVDRGPGTAPPAIPAAASTR